MAKRKHNPSGPDCGSDLPADTLARFERLAESEDDGAWRTRWRLTLKQMRWAKAYVGKAKGNATAAARLAGFSDDNVVYLRVVGHRMITNANVMRYVAHLLHCRRGGPRDVLAGMAELASVTADCFISFDASDRPYVDLAKARDAAALGAIRELVEESTTYDGKDGQPAYVERRIKVKLYDRQKSQDSLARIHGQIKSTLEVEGLIRHHQHDARPLMEKLLGDPDAYAQAKSLADRLGSDAGDN